MFGYALDCARCCDRLVNCYEVTKISCDTGIRDHSDLTKNVKYILNKLKNL